MNWILFWVVLYAALGVITGMAWAYYEIMAPKSVESRDTLLRRGLNPDLAILVWIAITLFVGIFLWPAMAFEILRRS